MTATAVYRVCSLSTVIPVTYFDSRLYDFRTWKKRNDANVSERLLRYLKLLNVRQKAKMFVAISLHLLTFSQSGRHAAVEHAVLL